MYGAEHVETLRAMHAFGISPVDQGKYKQAEELNRRTFVHNLADVLYLEGYLAEAARCDQETLALQKEILLHEHPDTIGTMNSLALALDALGRYDEAPELNLEILPLSEKIFGKEVQITLMSHTSSRCRFT